MYNILLTDDEQIVVDSLSFIINKNFENQVNIKRALSGTEAIELVTRENIDIIFMDINMPGLNGLETVSCIKKLKPETVIIMLSAFDRFQYAQEAMNLGAFKYITKPVNRNTVIQTIRSAMDFIDTNRGKQTADIELHKKLDLVSPMIESDFLYACIFNNDSHFDIDAYLSYFNLKEHFFQVCCFEIPNINSENQYSNFLKIRDTLNENHKCLVSSFITNRLIALYPLQDYEKDDSSFVTDLIQNTFNTLNFKIHSGIRAGISKNYDDWTKIKEAYNECINCLNQVPQNGGIFFSETATISTAEQNTSNLSEFKKQLFQKFRLGDLTGVTSFLDLYCSQLSNTHSELDKIKNALFEVIVTVRNTTEEFIPNYKNEAFDNAFSFFAKENDLVTLKDFVKRTMAECISAIISKKQKAENPIIKKVCDYINDNLSEDISLEQMAEYTKVSSFYLSKLFKEEKGVTFVNFLSDRRLEKAQEMLKNTDKPIKEITAEVGYNDQNYFSRLFKNKFGISPSDFRNDL